MERMLQEKQAAKIEDTEILTENTDEEKSATVEEAAGETAVTSIEAATVSAEAEARRFAETTAEEEAANEEAVTTVETATEEASKEEATIIGQDVTKVSLAVPPAATLAVPQPV